MATTDTQNLNTRHGNIGEANLPGTSDREVADAMREAFDRAYKDFPNEAKDSAKVRARAAEYMKGYITRVTDLQITKTVRDFLSKNLGQSVQDTRELQKAVGDALKDAILNAMNSATSDQAALVKTWGESYINTRNNVIQQAIAMKMAPLEAQKTLAFLGSLFGGAAEMIGTATGNQRMIDWGQAAKTASMAMAEDAGNKALGIADEAEHMLEKGPRHLKVYQQFEYDFSRQANDLIKNLPKTMDPALVRAMAEYAEGLRSVPGFAGKSASALTFSGVIPNFGADTVKPYDDATLSRKAQLINAPSEYDPLFKEMGEKYGPAAGVSPEVFAKYLKTRAVAESGLNPKADNGASGAKGEVCLGLMQMSIDTGKRYDLKTREDFFDPRKNVEAGARHMRDLAEKYGLENVHQFYYGGENTKGHGPNTMQYVANMKALEAVSNGAEIQAPAGMAKTSPAPTPKTAAAKGDIKITGVKTVDKPVKLSDAGIMIHQPDGELRPTFASAAAANADAYAGTSGRSVKLDAGQQVVALQQDGQETKHRPAVAVNAPLMHFALNIG